MCTKYLTMHTNFLVKENHSLERNPKWFVEKNNQIRGMYS